MRRGVICNIINPPIIYNYLSLFETGHKFTKTYRPNNTECSIKKQVEKLT